MTWGKSPQALVSLSEAGRSVAVGTGTRAEWSFQTLAFLGLWEQPAQTPCLCLFLPLCSVDRVCWYNVARGFQLPQSPQQGVGKGMGAA